jgi:transposase
MLSKTQATTQITQLHTDNNSLHSTKDVINRLQTYYLTPLHEQSKGHTKRLHQCTHYFQALNLLKDGGTYLDVARQLGIHHSQIMHWLDGRRPDYIELTRHIPPTPPGPDLKWLPLNLERAFVPTNLITVPDRVTHYTQVTQVLDQLYPLTNEAMQHWEQRFGPQNPEDAFYYLLGLIASDFDKQSSRISSTELVLNLSKNYTWSEQLGEAACYYLGQLGISAKKGKDRDSSAGPNTIHSWLSQKSPFITWTLMSCLGLKRGQRTTYHPVKMDWIFLASDNLRIAFLQGLSDGDGWASVKDQCIGIYSGPNIPLVKKLLKSYRIEASDDGQRVRIYSQDGIIKAAELPLFRFASSRLDIANKVAEMMRKRQDQEIGITFPEIVEEMQQLRNKGYSYGRIAEVIYDKYGISYDHSSVIRRLKKFKKDKND